MSRHTSYTPGCYALSGTVPLCQFQALHTDFDSHPKPKGETASVSACWLSSANGANCGILAVRRCQSLEHFGRHGETALQKHACEVLDLEGFGQAAHFLSPKIEVPQIAFSEEQRRNRLRMGADWIGDTA